MSSIGETIKRYEAGAIDDHGGIDAMVTAAYWAGREAMRGDIVRGLVKRRDEYQHGRYYHRERAALNEMMRDRLLGGEGRDDSAEILGWEFALAGSAGAP